jgi:hypothetical protein
MNKGNLKKKEVCVLVCSTNAAKKMYHVTRYPWFNSLELKKSSLNKLGRQG